MSNCNWNYDDPEWNTWDTECGHTFQLTEGTPAGNDMRFCPYCGGNLIQNILTAEADDDGL